MIKITSTDALLGIHITPARMSISHSKADFEMTTKHPKVIIDTEQVQIRIDQRQCFNESGLKDFTTLTREQAQEGRQAVLDGIARRVNEGKRMAAIENKSDAFADIAFNKFFDNHVFNMVTMPKSRPAIDYVGGTVDISVDEGYVDIRSKPNKPIIDVEAGDVEYFLKQYPDIKFEYIDTKL